MRDIEFRGKVKDDESFYGYKKDSWIYGNYSYDKLTNSTHIEDTSKENIANLEVDPVTVGQYIGLQDNNNKRIYEGDVLQDNADPDEIFLVDFCDGEFVLINDVNVYLDIENVHFLSVIGNIHDDKELYKFFKSEDK